jgi:NADH dehydrogenase
LILVSGGTGFVGSHLIPRLATRDEKIRCLVRSPAKTKTLQEHGAELALGDVTDSQSLSAAMHGVDTVIHLVAIIRETRNATFSKVNAQGTRNVAEAAKASGVKRFIHMSALGASPNPRYRYTYSKWQGEEAVRSSKLDFVIFRPSAIFGQGFGYSFIDSMIRSLKILPFIAPVPGSGKTRFQPIWVEDVVSCIIQTLENEKGSQTYEIGGPEHLSYEEMLDTVIHAMSMRRVKLHIPIPLMRLAVIAMERTMSNPPVTSVELAQLELDNITDLDSVECRFGFKPLALNQGLDYIKPS